MHSLNLHLMSLAFIPEVKTDLIKNYVVMEGIFSGYFHVDFDGTWNGSSFTMSVTDSLPHFFYSSTWKWESSNCSILYSLSSFTLIPEFQDVLFVLNPVLRFP